jgi:NitT/TauT family transport system ATP-binding protein
VSLRFISQDGNATVALRDFSMSVARGEFVAVVGPTGCGKSTTLNMITGLLKPTVGEVKCDGRSPWTGIDPRIGFVFQADAVFPWRSVLDNVAAGPLFAASRESEAYDALAHEWLAAWASTSSASTIRISCPAACASAWRWRRPSSTTPRSC